MALQAGGWAGVSEGHGLETQGLLGVEVPISKTLIPTGWGGIQRHADGSIDLRDTTVALAWLPVRRDDLSVRVQPGLSLPTGGLTSGLYFTSLSTASVDPWLGVDVMGGGAWLVGGSLVARVPLYEGWDHVRQGPFVRAELRGARRVGDLVPFAGASVVRLFPGSVSRAGDFAELAASAGSVWNVSKRWSLTAQLRVPVWVSATAERQLSGGLSVRAVLDLWREPEEPH